MKLSSDVKCVDIQYFTEIYPTHTASFCTLTFKFIASFCTLTFNFIAIARIFFCERIHLSLKLTQLVILRNKAKAVNKLSAPVFS